MADEKPFIPPLRKPVGSFITPSHTVIFYTELVNRDDPAYYANAPVKRGTVYSTIVGAKQDVIDGNPTLYFVRETKYQTSDQLVLWLWTSDEKAHDTYNSDDTYALESIHHPGFVRDYTIRRDEYYANPAIALGLPLATLTGVKIVNGGGNYTQATGTIAGTTVAIDFVILDGAIISGIVTDMGEGITGESVIVVTGDGADAVVEPIVQSSSCVLIGQKKVELDEQDPLAHEFIKLIRTYATLPGPTINSTRIDEDGVVVNISTTMKVANQIVPGEQLLAGQWIVTQQEQKDNSYTADEVVQTRAIPGNPIPSTTLDKDGIEIDRVRTLKDTTKIITQEYFVGNVWTKTTKEPLSMRLRTDTYSDLVSWEVVEGRVVGAGNFVPSARVGEDHETELIQKSLENTTTIVPGASESGGILKIIEKEEVSDLVSWQSVSNKQWLDRALYSQRLPESIIPVEFRASIPTVTESHTVVGTATMPILSGSQIFTSEQQLTKIFKEVRTESLGLNLNFPIIQVGYETTEEYGGGVLSVTRTLNNSALTVEQGEDVVRSVVNPIGTNLMWIRETHRRYTDIAWPTLTEYDQDPETQSLITTTYNVVDAATVVAPSVVNGVITRYKKIDKWRSLQIVETYSLPASYEEQRFMAHTFPSLWDWTTYNYNTACGATGYIRQGFATMVQARLAISFTTSKQTITGLTLIPNTHHLVHDIVANVLNDFGVINYFGACSGPVTLPVSSPSYTTYITTIQNTEQLISGESVRWRAGLYKNSSLYITML